MKGTGTTSLHVYFFIQQGKWERCSSTRAGAEYVKRPVFLSFALLHAHNIILFFVEGASETRGATSLRMGACSVPSLLAFLYAFAEAGICCSSDVAPLCLGSSDLRIRLFGELVLSTISYEHLYIYTFRKDSPKWHSGGRG